MQTANEALAQIRERLTAAGHDAEAFLAKTSVMPNGCIEWTAYRNHNGYPIIHSYDARCRNHGTRTNRAHRWLYEHIHGPIKQGLELDHLCRNRACVHPGHLEPVTAHQNGIRAPNSPRAINHRRYMNALVNDERYNQNKTARRNAELEDRNRELYEAWNDLAEPEDT